MPRPDTTRKHNKVTAADARVFNKRVQGKTVRQIAAEEQISTTTVQNRTKKVADILGFDPNDILKEIVTECRDLALHGLKKALKRSDSSAINGFYKGIGVYTERGELSVNRTGLSDDELADRILKRLTKSR